MTNRSKDKGTAAETRVVKYLEAAGLRAMRVVQKGNKDQGDIHILRNDGIVCCTLEVKGGQQTINVNRKLRHGWLDETRKEGENAGMIHAFLVIAKHGSSCSDYHVWHPDGHRFWYLDEFVDHVKGGF